MKNIPEIIYKNKIFKKFTKESIAMLLSYFKKRAIHKSEILYQENMPARYFFIILSRKFLIEVGRLRPTKNFFDLLYQFPQLGMNLIEIEASRMGNTLKGKEDNTRNQKILVYINYGDRLESLLALNIAAAIQKSLGALFASGLNAQAIADLFAERIYDDKLFLDYGIPILYFLKFLSGALKRPPILVIANRAMMIEGTELMKLKKHYFDHLIQIDIRDFGLFDFHRREEMIRMGKKQTHLEIAKWKARLKTPMSQ